MALAKAYPVTRLRRAMTSIYATLQGLVALAAVQAWRDTGGTFWLLVGGAALCLMLWLLRVVFERPIVAQITGDRIDLFGPTGHAKSLHMVDIQAAKLDPTLGTGVIVYRAEFMEEERFGFVSFRAMGRQAASDFVARIAKARPGLPLPGRVAS